MCARASSGRHYWLALSPNVSPRRRWASLHVALHDGHPLRMDGQKVGVFEQTNKVPLEGLLEGYHRPKLDPGIGQMLLRIRPDEPLERRLPDQEVGAPLVLADLP